MVNLRMENKLLKFIVIFLSVLLLSLLFNLFIEKTKDRISLDMRKKINDIEYGLLMIKDIENNCIITHSDHKENFIPHTEFLVNDIRSYLDEL